MSLNLMHFVQQLFGQQGHPQQGHPQGHPQSQQQVQQHPQVRSQQQIAASPFKMYEDHSFQGNPAQFAAQHPSYQSFEDNTFRPPLPQLHPALQVMQQHHAANLGAPDSYVHQPQQSFGMQVQNVGGYPVQLQPQAPHSWQHLGGIQNMYNPQVQDQGYYWNQ